MQQAISFIRPQDRVSDPEPIAGGRVEVQLFTTLDCNLKCTYCSVAVGEVLGSQGKVSYSLEDLDAFIGKHLSGKEIYITFYGGEPTLNIEFIESVMRRYPTFRYQLQTNGTLLNRLPDAVLRNLSNVLCSIDGGEAVTDGYRGKGVYRKVTKNLARIRDKVGGSLTARVTWGHEDTSFEELDGLLETFDYVYWQFAQAEGYYTPAAMEGKRAVLRRLIDRFFASTGRLYPFIPIMGMVRNKLMPSRARELYQGLTQCRASTHIINVLPDGKIYPCPDLTYRSEMQQGDLKENWLRRSPLQPAPTMPCDACEAFAFCRRNCMKNLYVAYVANDEQYRTQVVEPVCELIRFMGREIDTHDMKGWYAGLPVAERRRLADCEVYEYVEIMP